MPGSTRGRLTIFLVVVILVIGMLPMMAASAAESESSPRAGWGQQLAQPIIIINTSYQNVRSGPGAIYSIIGTLPGGSELPVLGRNRDSSWWQAQTPFGIGWVSAEFVIPRGDFRVVPVVQVQGIVQRPVVAVVNSTVNVYVFPDASSSLLGLALVGSELPVAGQTADGTWWQVETNVGLGWTLQEDVALRGNAAGVPIVGVGGGAILLPPDGQGGGGIAAGGTTPGIMNNNRPIVYVFSESVPLRRAADPASEAIAVMYRGDRAEVLDFNSTRDWALVLFMGDWSGWLPVADVAMSDPTQWRTQVWWNGPGVLDLKEQPDLSSRTTVSIPAQERLIVLNDADGPGGGWLLVSHNLGRGWIRALDIEIIRNGPRTQPGGDAMTGAQLSGAVIQPSLSQMVAVPQPVRSYIIVNTSFLNVRSGPGAQFTTVYTVRGGTEMDILASTPDGIWFKVRGSGGTGWVNSEFVIFRGDFGNVPILTYQDAAGQVTAPVVIVSAPINVYQGPGVDTGLLGTAPAGLTMPVLGGTSDGVWIQVQTSSGPGWVLASTVILRGG